MAHFVVDTSTLMLLAVLIGITTSLTGAMCNVLVIEGTPIKQQGKVLSGLHMMYGFGSMFAALTVATTLRHEISWPWIVTAPTPFILVFLFFLFKKLKPNAQGIRKETALNSLSKFQILAVVLFSLYVAGEVISSMWLSSYLVERYSWTVPDSANYCMGFFAVMTLTRFLCFLFISKKQEKTIMLAALLIPIAAFILGLSGFPWAFVLVGCVGPFFPLFLARVSRTFPNAWRSMTIWIIIGMQGILVVSHLSLGRVADLFTINKAYILGVLLLIATYLLLLLYLRLEKQRIRDNMEIQ
jgi:fucose permease